MGKSSEVASNTAEGAAAGKKSVEANEVMRGVTKAFETRVDNLDRESVEKGLNGAFSAYFEKHRHKVDSVENSGVAISKNIISVAEHVSMTDGDAEKGFRPTGQFLNPALAPYLNPKHADESQLPVGVMAPDYYERDPNLLRRGVND